MENYTKPEALQLKSLTGQVQGVAQPLNKPQGKGSFTQSSCCEHTTIMTPASGTRAAPEQDQQAAEPAGAPGCRAPAPQVLTRCARGFNF